MVKKDESWPGLDSRWKGGWKAHFKNANEWYDIYIDSTRHVLDQYASTGQRSSDEDLSNHKRWERGLSSQLEMYALLKAFDLESSALIENIFDIRTAQEIYAAARIEELMRLYVLIRSPERVGRQLRTMNIHIMPAVALGVIIGDVSAVPLMRLLIAACRRGWYSLDQRFPVFIFMLLITADFLDEVLPDELALLLGNSPLGDLLSGWDNPDPTALVELCIATCNFHTTRCRGGDDMEFANGNWRYVPVELMLLMRLRLLRGLSIPHFEHPIWIAPFAKFVSAEPPPQSEFMQRFEERMRIDGFDEEFITQNVLMDQQGK